LFETLGGPGAGGGSRPRSVLASLFLHHLDTPELGRLGGLIEAGFDRVLCVEPARYRWFRCLGHAFFPFVNAVTRHDLQVSIGAGFRRGEIRASLGLGAGWAVRETLSPLGAYRFEAWRP
jgi:hypothetical protein